MKVLMAFGSSIILLQQGIAIGQTTANALHNRYPAPSREQIELRPGISITVQYGKRQVACEIRIHPTSASLLGKDSDSMMIPDAVTEIIKEIIPQEERGKAGTFLISSAGCNQQFRKEYEFVDITRSSHECLPLQPAREFPALLIFKWPECASLRRGQNVQPAK